MYSNINIGEIRMDKGFQIIGGGGKPSHRVAKQLSGYAAKQLRIISPIGQISRISSLMDVANQKFCHPEVPEARQDIGLSHNPPCQSELDLLLLPLSHWRNVQNAWFPTGSSKFLSEPVCRAVSGSQGIKTPQQVRGEKRSLAARLHSRIAAFTLAEVLITLGIIGIVAAMTIPTLIAKYQERQTITRLTKVYSTMAQAWQMMQVEHGAINTWGGMSNTNTGNVDPETGKTIYDFSAQSLVASRLKPYLKVVKTCTPDEPCDKRPSYSISGDLLSDGSTRTCGTGDSPCDANFYLNDGTYIGMGYYTKALDRIDILVILPGNEITLGKTKFFFYGKSTGFIPEGVAEDGIFTKCRLGSTSQDGRGCAAWIIYNKNMDYLHCRDELSWNGKHSCKD